MLARVWLTLGNAAAFQCTEAEVDADAPRKVYQGSQYGKSCSLSKEQFNWKKREIKHIISLQMN